MSDGDSGDDKPKGLDLSKLGLEMSDEECAAAKERLKEDLKELAHVASPMTDRLGGLSAARDAMAGLHEPGLSAAQEALAGLADVQGLSAAQEAMAGLHEPGLSAAQEAMARVSGVHLSAAQRAADSMASIQNVERQIDRIRAVERMNDSLAGLSAAQEAMAKLADIQGLSAAQDAQKALGVLPEGFMDTLAGTSALHDRVRDLAGLGDDSSFSRIAAGLSEQQNILDSMHQDRADVSPALRDIRIPENPLIETNKRLERIERRFDQISTVAETSAQTATELQLASAEFLKDFKEAASKNDEAAADAIRLGKRAVWAAILIPILVFGAQIAANAFMPNREMQALQQTVVGLQTEIDELQAANAAETQRLIDAIAASDEATAAAILEGLRALQAPAAGAPEHDAANQ